MEEVIQTESNPAMPFKILSDVISSSVFGSLPLVLAGLATKAFKNGFIYQPLNNMSDLNKVSKKFKKLTIRTIDKHRVTGYFFKNPSETEESNPLPLVIRFQENAGGFVERQNFYLKFSEKFNCHFLAISYRGYGASKGYPNKAGIERDALATMKHVFEKLIGKKLDAKTRVYVHGRSIGSSVAAFVASREEFKNLISGVILDIPFSRMEDLGIEFMPCLEKVKEDVFEGEDWDVLKSLEGIETKVMVSGAKEDEICAFWHYEKIVEKAKGLKIELTEVVFEKGGHNDCLEKISNWKKYSIAMKEFLKI